MFKDLILVVSEKVTTTKDVIRIRDGERPYKLILKEQKLRVHENKIIMLDTSTMTLEGTIYYEKRKAEIIQRRLMHSSLAQ